MGKVTDWPVGSLRRIGMAVAQAIPDNRPCSTEQHVRVYQGMLVRTFVGYQSTHLIKIPDGENCYGNGQWIGMQKYNKEEFWEWHIQFQNGALLGPIREDYLNHPGICAECDGYTIGEDYLCPTCRVSGVAKS